MSTELPDHYCAKCGVKVIYTASERFRFDRKTGEKIYYGKWHCPTFHCAHDGNSHDFQKAPIWFGLRTEDRCVHCGITEDQYIYSCYP